MSTMPLPTHEDLAAAVVPALRTELPGPLARDLIGRDRVVTSPSLGRVHPLVPARAGGCVVEDVDGNRFLDFNAGIAVTSTGHCHPDVVDAIERQSHALLHYCSSDWYVPAYIEVCERLAATSPTSKPARVFLGNSGTEAVEAAIKLARHSTGRPNLIAFHGAFHGRTLGSLSLTASKARYRGGFGPLLPGVFHAPYGDFGYIQHVLFGHLTRPEDVAAIFVEPIQGEGGYVLPPSGWLAHLREVCDTYGILLVADEVQTGVGRTGRMWAIEHDEVAPDVLLAGKGLASGLPLSAVIARADVMQWEPGMHGSTFGGNPVSSAAALATLDLVEGELTQHAAEMGRHVLARLAQLRAHHGVIRNVHGRGLMVGIELADADAARHVEHEAFRRGLIVLTAGESVVRLSPALVVTREQVDIAIDILDGVLRDNGVVTTINSVDELLALLARGDAAFDEPHLDALAHALQCGALLRAQFPADDDLAVAGLVHDISDIADPTDHRDHDARGAALVAPLLGPRVARLVGAHVVAKRYLVTTDPAYRSQLSVRSVETLAAQGDALDKDALAALTGDPDLEAILALRRADEGAKDPHAQVPDLESWRPVLEQVAARG